MEPTSKTVKRSKLVTATDDLVSGESFDILWDPNTQIAQTNVPDSIDLSNYYQSAAYDSHKELYTGLLGYLYIAVRNIMSRQKLRSIIENLGSKPQQLLDYGCGTGFFMKYLKAKKIKVFGIEPNSGARALAQKKGLLVHEDIAQVQQSPIDVISLWHVLEHTPEPGQLVKQFYNRLSNKGLLVLALPNLKSDDAAYYQGDWAGYDVPRHLWHFSKTGVIQLIEKQGFKHKKTYKMPFDAYYISLLSEKKRQQSFALLKGFYRGLMSNLKARKTGEYSSLMYVFQKD